MYRNAIEGSQVKQLNVPSYYACFNNTYCICTMITQMLFYRNGDFDKKKNYSFLINFNIWLKLIARQLRHFT